MNSPRAATAPTFCTHRMSPAGRWTHCIGSRSRMKLARSMAILGTLASPPPKGDGVTPARPRRPSAAGLLLFQMRIDGSVRPSGHGSADLGLRLRHVAAAGVRLALGDDAQ